MNYTYTALIAAILLVVFLLARWVVKAQRRFGWGAAWLVILLEACAVGAAMYLAVQYVPGMGDTWIGQQLILAIVGIGLAIVLGGGIPSPRFRLPERIAPRFTPCSAASLTNWSRLVPLVTQAASFGASRSSIPNPRGLSGLGCSGSIAKISR